MLYNELRFPDLASGVSSLSAFSGDDMFSAPDEKSTSNLRGVVKAGWPKTDLGAGLAGWACWEKKKGWEFGARR
jgi:hypothetical protein